ncbi:hypothetical protein M5689_023443 [Euphorbia peplus]|nr:hypothetical protein M5689_023443 [Euphorbia peplus]
MKRYRIILHLIRDSATIGLLDFVTTALKSRALRQDIHYWLGKDRYLSNNFAPPARRRRLILRRDEFLAADRICIE